MSIAKRLHDRRIELGLTLEQVGDACGVSKATVQRWETGSIRNMRRDRLKLLANTLRLNPAELIDAQGAESIDAADLDRLEALHQNPRLGLLFDRQRTMKPEDIDFMMTIAERILKERGGD